MCTIATICTSTLILCITKDYKNIVAVLNIHRIHFSLLVLCCGTVGVHEGSGE